MPLRTPLTIAVVPWSVIPAARVWFFKISVPSGATVRCLKCESAGGASPEGSVPVRRMRPVPGSSRAAWFDHAVTIVPLARMLRLLTPIQLPVTLAFST